MTRSRDLVNYKNQSWHKMDGKNEKSVLKLAKLPSLRPLALKSEFLLEFEFLKNYKDLYGKCCWWARSAHQQYTNLSNVRKIQAAIKTHSAALGGWNLATFIFLTWSFHFWHLFCTRPFLMIDKVTRPFHAKSLLPGFKHSGQDTLNYAYNASIHPMANSVFP